MKTREVLKKKIVAGVAHAASTVKAWMTPAPRTQVESTLDDLNDTFHARYDGLRAKADHKAPVMVVLGDVLIVYRDPKPTEREFTAPSFHAIKGAAHVPIALFMMLHEVDGRPIDDEMRGALESLKKRSEESLGEIPGATPEATNDVHIVLRSSADFARTAITNGTIARGEAASFARSMGPLLSKLTEHATRAQLAALDVAVDEELASLSAEERRGLHVVVTGDHQARTRSLAMQYFQKRFGEEPGEEERVTYAESLESPADAVALIGTQRLDRLIATSFFGDKKRLQRDVLGDAAAALLDERKLDPIV